MITAVASRGSIYYRSYSRALLKYVNNGFFARDLDADDHAFIETVRERRCLPCGSLGDPAVTACTYSDDVIRRISLLEEMEFWQQPYQIDDKIVIRRHGPVARTPTRPAGSTPNAEKRKRDQELAAAERAAELRQIDERRAEQLRRDIEWEKAAPERKLKFGRIKDRHYIPQWKVDEIEAEEAVKQRERDLVAAEVAKLRLEAEREAERQRAQEVVIDAQIAAKLHRVAVDAELRKRREQHEAAQRLAQLQTPPQQENDERVAQLQNRILVIMNGTYPQLVTIEQLLAATGCEDKEFLLHCADDLVRSGKLMHKSEAAA
jgi:hypothetical protein